MKIIAHRGNIDGPDPFTENTPLQIERALVKGYDVEVDVWVVGSKYFLGHDKPEKEVSFFFLQTPGLWLHCKNMAAARFLNREPLNGFVHENQSFVRTSHGYLWTFPGQILHENSVAVLPELVPGWDLSKAYAICTDYGTH